MIVALLVLAGCTPEADVSTLPPIASVPLVPDAPVAAASGESKALEMDFAGGQSGAPYGMAFFIPPGTQAVATTGLLSDGSEGFSLTAQAAGDAVVCSQPIGVAGPITISARQRVTTLGAVAQAWHGAQVELRARTEDGRLVEVPGTRYLPLRQVNAAGDWETWDQRVDPPAGSRKVELCWRLVGTTGTIEVDRATVVSDGVPLPAPIPVVSVRWDLDTPGPSGAPEGFEFMLPPGTRGASLTVSEGAIRFESSSASNALACSQPFSVAPGMLFRGRYRLRDLQTDARTWTGFVAEVRTYDMIGGLASPAGLPFSVLQTWKAPTAGWAEFESAFAPPVGAVTGKLCFRFVESTGAVDLDWAAVGPG
ncbi:MAG: hypothetical protein Q8P41_20415 [Pseudomonadota bacterium]|nr:hypothetical protein [Pseudomonadota bacterium]